MQRIVSLGGTVKEHDKTMKTGREVIGLFADRESFEAAIADLQAAGFERTDLSVLASHDSIDAAGAPGKPWQDALTALVGEIKYEGPLVASGAILLAGGPVAATIAGIIGATVGGVALKEVLEEMTAKPHTKEFGQSLEAGSVILWVSAATDEREGVAMDILKRHGGFNIHVNERPAAR